MYTPDDPRSRLAPTPPVPTASSDQRIRPAQFIEFHDAPATSITPTGSRQWVARSQNLVVVWIDGVAGDSWTTTGVLDQMLVLPKRNCPHLEVTAGGRTVEVEDEAVVCIPPGTTTVTLQDSGSFCRLIPASDASAWVASALNTDVYRQPDPRVRPLVAEPSGNDEGPVVHRLTDHPVEQGRFGRIFSSRSIMVNFLPEQVGPRDPTKLSPHHHDDFEQISLAVAGDFVHHIRYPWYPDSTLWRADDHRRVGSPSIAVIPPPTVHTSEGVGPYQELIDVFSPPRADFRDAGWIRNDTRESTR